MQKLWMSKIQNLQCFYNEIQELQSFYTQRRQTLATDIHQILHRILYINDLLICSNFRRKS